MSSIIKPTAKPFYEAEVWEYKDRIVAHCTCNLCGEKFSLTLRANPAAIMGLTVEQKKYRIFSLAHKKHQCDTDALKVDKAETNRIVNKWHEFKLKTKKTFGGTDAEPTART